METQGDLEETWLFLLCSCGQTKAAWVGAGVGRMIKHTAARQYGAHCDARDAQRFTSQSCVSAGLCISEIHLLTYPWKRVSLTEINRSSAIDCFRNKADFRDLPVSSIHQSKEAHLHVSHWAQCLAAACAWLKWGHGVAEHFLPSLTRPVLAP